MSSSLKSSVPLWRLWLRIFCKLGVYALAPFAARSATAFSEPTAVAPSTWVVIVDPGHGGEDLGAVAYKRREKDIALEIARKLKSELNQLPKTRARLTRDSDEFVELSERVLRAEAAQGNVFISLHGDQVRKAGPRRGIVLYIYGKNRLIPKGPLRRPGEKIFPPPPRAQVESSRRLAVEMWQELRSKGFRLGPIDRGAFAVLKSSRMPSVLVEVGNMWNRAESDKITDPAFQDRLSQALASGIKRYLRKAR